MCRQQGINKQQHKEQWHPQKLEDLNIDEAEENNLKINFRKMFETLKEEMKHSLKEGEKKNERNQQNLQGKPIKNTIKQVKETFKTWEIKED